MRLGALLLLLQLPAGDTQSCDDFEDDNGDLWDLSSLVGLRTASGPAPTGTWTYKFDVCANISPNPTACQNCDVLGTVAARYVRTGSARGTLALCSA